MCLARPRPTAAAAQPARLHLPTRAASATACSAAAAAAAASTAAPSLSLRAQQLPNLPRRSEHSLSFGSRAKACCCATCACCAAICARRWSAAIASGADAACCSAICAAAALSTAPWGVRLKESACKNASTAEGREHGTMLPRPPSPQSAGLPPWSQQLPPPWPGPPPAVPPVARPWRVTLSVPSRCTCCTTSMRPIRA
jgi:hypothetical protein